MIILSQYSTAYDARRDVFVIRSQEDIPLCSLCGWKLRTYGYRRRHVIAGDGFSRVYELQRLRCDNCCTVQLWLPSFISTRRYYDRETIQGAVTGTLTSCPAEDSTIRRWKRKERAADELQPVLPVNSSVPVVKCKGTVEKEDVQ